MNTSEHATSFLCVGGANLDRKVQGLAPLQLGTSNPAVSSKSFGGVARNIAENLARMGADSSLYTLVGADAEGDSLMSACKDAGIDTSLTEMVPQARTGNYTAILDETGNLLVAMADMQIYDEFTRQRTASNWQRVKEINRVIADTNLPSETLAFLIEESRNHGGHLCIVPVSAPKVQRLPGDLDGVHLLILNRDELHRLIQTRDKQYGGNLDPDPNRDHTPGPETSSNALRNACIQLQTNGCKNVIVTQGEKEVLALSEFGEVLHIPVPPVDVVEVTGAGDAFASGVIFGFYELKMGLAAAIRLGIALAQATLQSMDTVSSIITPDFTKTLAAKIRNIHRG